MCSLIKKVCNLIPVVLIEVFILFMIYVFTQYHLLSQKFSFDISSAFQLILCLIYYWSGIMTVICHIITIKTDPGFVSSDSYQFKETTLQLIHCSKCSHLCPIRSNHCWICKKCVIKMDHHCFFVGNCIGLKNQKSFYLFLLYIVISTLIQGCCFANQVSHIDFGKQVDILINKTKSGFLGDINLMLIYEELKEPIISTFAMISSFFMLLSIGVLFIIQTRLIGKNLTTIENNPKKKNAMKFLIDNGRFCTNFSNVFGLKGRSVIWWFIPIFEENINNNGLNFITSFENAELSNVDYQNIQTKEENKISIDNTLND